MSQSALARQKQGSTLRAQGTLQLIIERISAGIILRWPRGPPGGTRQIASKRMCGSSIGLIFRSPAFTTGSSWVPRWSTKCSAGTGTRRPGRNCRAVDRPRGHRALSRQGRTAMMSKMMASCSPPANCRAYMRELALSADPNHPATGRTNSIIAALNLDGSSTNGSCPDSSNQTSLFEGAVSTSK